MSSTSAPEILWAQRSSATEPEKNLVLLTINVPNLPEGGATRCDLTSTSLSFAAEVAGDAAKGIEGKKYSFDIDFYDEIDVDASKQQLTAKSLYLVLRKSKAQEEYWPRLTKDKVRLHNVKTDFSKWVDEDEQNEVPEETDDMGGMPGMGAGGMPGMGAGGMPGMGAGGMPDMSALGGGGGGMGGLDLQALMAQMGGGAGGEGGFPGMEGLEGEEGDEEGDAEEQIQAVDEASA